MNTFSTKDAEQRQGFSLFVCHAHTETPMSGGVQSVEMKLCAFLEVAQVPNLATFCEGCGVPLCSLLTAVQFQCHSSIGPDSTQSLPKT